MELFKFSSFFILKNIDWNCLISLVLHNQKNSKELFKFDHIFAEKRKFLKKKNQNIREKSERIET